MDQLMETPFYLDADGMLSIPDTPGLGVTLSPDQVARYTPDAATFFSPD